MLEKGMLQEGMLQEGMFQEVMLQTGDPQKVLKAVITREKKIILLWMITQLDYRGPIGEEALEALAEIIPDNETRGALFSIAGFASAKPTPAIWQETFCDMTKGILW